MDLVIRSVAQAKRKLVEIYEIEANTGCRDHYVTRFIMNMMNISQYRSGTVNSNTVNSKYHLIRSFFEIFARFLSFHV